MNLPVTTLQYRTPLEYTQIVTQFAAELQTVIPGELVAGNNKVARGRDSVPPLVSNRLKFATTSITRPRTR